MDAEGRAKQEARAENLSVYAIHEDEVPFVFEHGADAAIADLIPLVGEKCIYRSAQG